MFTVAKINLILTALRFDNSNASRGYKTYNNKSKGPHMKWKSKQSINRLRVSSRDTPFEGGKSCEWESTNQNQTYGLNQRLRNVRSNLVGAITQSKECCLDLSNSRFTIQNLKSKWKKVRKNEEKKRTPELKQ